ncbi:hypothetical protein D3Z36_11000 [Lachnospiraceae bacterium]|nr:hypothetical protein [Lachnospiraceae bacterium]
MNYKLFELTGIFAFAVLFYFCINYRKISKMECMILITVCVFLGFSAFGAAAYFKMLSLFGT